MIFNFHYLQNINKEFERSPEYEILKQILLDKLNNFFIIINNHKKNLKVLLPHYFCFYEPDTVPITISINPPFKTFFFQLLEFFKWIIIIWTISKVTKTNRIKKTPLQIFVLKIVWLLLFILLLFPIKFVLILFFSIFLFYIILIRFKYNFIY